MKVLICAFACAKDPDMQFGFSNGGEGILGQNIILQLIRFFNVSVLTHPINKEAIEKIVKKRNVPEIDFYYIDIPKFFNFTKKWIQIYAYLWQIKAYFVAKRLNKENHFDVFHHITYANDWMASYIGALLPIPYMRGPGGGAQKVPENFLRGFSKKDYIKEKIRSLGQWMFKHDPFFIIGQNKAKVLLVCNHESFRALPKKWQAKAFFFSVNGIHSEEVSFLRSEGGHSNDNFLILSAGKLIKIKGFDLAIKAFKLFSDNVADAKLVIVGDGVELKNLKKLVKELNLEVKVIFKEWMSHGELFKQMLSCDIFLFASLRDGGGAVVVEAMAAGKPVVCFDLAGPALHIDEKCGIKVKADNPEQAAKDMSSALEKLYLNRELLSKLGGGAKEKAEKEYNWNKLGDKLFEIYKNTLKF